LSWTFPVIDKKVDKENYKNTPRTAFLVRKMKPKHGLKIGVVTASIICIICLAIFALFRPPIWGFVAGVTIIKLSSPPECYFNLTQEDINRYPFLIELLDKIEKENRTSVHKELKTEEGEEIYNYMRNRMKEEGGNCGGIFFFYKNRYYRMRVSFTWDHMILWFIRGKDQPTTYKVIRGLLKERLVIVSRKIGRSKLYKLNTRNEVVKTILKFEFEIAKKLLTWRRKRQRNIVNLHLKYNILRSQPGN